MCTFNKIHLSIWSHSLAVLFFHGKYVFLQIYHEVYGKPTSGQITSKNFKYLFCVHYRFFILTCIRVLSSKTIPAVQLCYWFFVDISYSIWPHFSASHRCYIPLLHLSMVTSLYGTFYCYISVRNFLSSVPDRSESAEPYLWVWLTDPAFCQWTPKTPTKKFFCLLLFEVVIMKLQKSKNPDFSHYFCLMMEGCGSGSEPLTNGSGSGRPQKNFRIRKTVYIIFIVKQTFYGYNSACGFIGKNFHCIPFSAP